MVLKEKLTGIDANAAGPKARDRCRNSARDLRCFLLKYLEIIEN